MKSARSGALAELRIRAWQLRAALPPGRVPRPAPWGGPATSLPPIFIGGTGRSGTTITARILGAHPAYYVIPFEVRFISDSNGLCDLVAGRTTSTAFERKLLGKWWHRDDRLRLSSIADRRTVRAAVQELHRGLEKDPFAAGARFVHRLLDPPAVAAGARGWIEMTPANVRVAGEVARILPTSRHIHSVRDGRDVACSIRPLAWGPDDLDEALDWWARRLAQGYERTSRVPADRLLVIHMESLLVTAREPEYERLRSFAGLTDDEAMRAFFDTKATAGRAHIGRWLADVPAEARGPFNAHYQRLVAELVAAWGHAPPAEVPPAG